MYQLDSRLRASISHARARLTSSSIICLLPRSHRPAYSSRLCVESRRARSSRKLDKMSVLLETSLGDLVVDLETKLCPETCRNFLGLCASYRYNLRTFFSVQRDFIAQTGSPNEDGTGGESIFNLLPKSSPAYSSSPYFTPEFKLPKLKHGQRGTVSMACAKLDAAGTLGCAAQFFFTLADDQTYLDGAHVPFGRVVEGLETLDKINEAFTDEKGRPLRDIRIRHVIVLDEGPWGPDFGLPGLIIPPNSPVPTPAMLKSLRVGDDEDLERAGVTEEQKEQERREADARAQALTLEMVGDLPFADVKVPEASLFVCKLNSVTTSEDVRGPTLSLPDAHSSRQSSLDSATSSRAR